MSAQRCKEILCSNLAGGLAAAQANGGPFTFERKAIAYSQAAADLAASGEQTPAGWAAEMIAAQEGYLNGLAAEKYVAACVDLWAQLTE